MIKEVLVVFFVAFSISFILNAQEWEEEIKLGSGIQTNIAVDSNNCVHTVWSNNEIWYWKSCDGGNTWDEFKLLSRAEGHCHWPDIAIDSKGTIHVVWGDEFTDGNSSTYVIYYSKSTDGGDSWTVPKQIRKNTVDESQYPRIGINSNDIIYVIWCDVWPPGAIGEYSSKYFYIKSDDFGNTWSEPKLITWGTYGWDSDVEIDLNDNIYVFFNFIKEKTEAGLFCFKSTNSGDTWTFSKPCGWGGPFATIDTNNVIHLAYWVNDEICYQKSQDGGQTWTEPKKLDSASGIPSQTAIKPNIASDSNNALHVVYDNSASEKSELYYQRSPDGGENWTKKERLTYKTGVFTEPKISADSNLGIHIVWECYTHKEVYYKRGLFTKPEAPTDLGVTAISSNICELTWHDNSNNEDGFKIERSLYADKEFNEVGFVLENITSYTDTEFNAGTTCYYRVRACYGPAYSEYSNTASLTRSTIQLDRTQFYFGATTAGATTGSQRFLISNIGGGTLNWSVTTDKNWLNCNPSSGTSSGSVNVSVDASGLSAGNYIGAINIEDPHASNSPQTVNVSLVVFDSGSTNPPFGTFETPVHGSTVQSSVAVTGWVLDDIGVESVKIYRESGKNLVYIGDGLFVEGARSDIEQAYPSHPMNYKAGWGYMMLTNFLPNEGNGTFKIHAIAADTEGHEVTLGVKTITCDNANAVKPFGAIDTPTQGGTASGSNFINWGWVLTPQPNSIPTDGSTINVYVDGFNLGHPTYNVYRKDIATLFPGYANINGAVGYFYLDTTSYENGVHTIQWTATDDAGNTDGIGSRYFAIQNTGASGQRSLGNAHLSLDNERLFRIPVDYSEPIEITKGYKRNNTPQKMVPDEKGFINIEIRELERVEINLNNNRAEVEVKAEVEEGNSDNSNFYTGYLVVGNQIRPLPIGSTLDSERGIFYWQPGPGFIGVYRIVFIKKEKAGMISKKSIIVKIVPKFT